MKPNITLQIFQKRMSQSSLRFCAATLIFFMVVTAGHAQTQVWPAPRHFVSDFAEVIENTHENRINALAQKLKEVSQDELAVVTLRSYETRGFGSIEETAVDLFETWGIGKQGEDNGLLILVAVEEREWRIEVGYGLEGMVPDAIASNLGRTLLTPHFRAGSYGAGLEELSVALVSRIADQRGIPLGQFQITERPRTGGSARANRSVGVMGSFGSILFGLFMMYMFIRHPRLFLLMMLLNGGGRRNSHWGGGSHFGGGFGGGLSGGGGASGRW